MTKASPVQGSWFVIYKDDTELHQYDAQAASYDKEAGEVPLRAIDWPQVAQLYLESQYVQPATCYDVVPPPEGYETGMRLRTFMAANGTAIRTYIITISEAGKPVDSQSVIAAHYWFPNGLEHSCGDFDCSEVRKYAASFVNGKPGALMPATHELTTNVTY